MKTHLFCQREWLPGPGVRQLQTALLFKPRERRRIKTALDAGFQVAAPADVHDADVRSVAVVACGIQDDLGAALRLECHMTVMDFQPKP